jgi:hypothetical protein
MPMMKMICKNLKEGKQMKEAKEEVRQKKKLIS